MMNQLRRIVLMAAIATSYVAIILPAAPASAEDVAGLSFETGELDSELAEALEETAVKAADSVGKWTLIGFETARAKMSPVTRDCFTEDCLTKAGTAIGAPAGLSIELSGEAQIYEWTVNVWDLRSGKKLNSAEGDCQLCGRAEVERTFEASVRKALSGADLPSVKPATSRKAAPDKPDDGGSVALRVSVVPEDAEIYVNDQLAGTGEVDRGVGPGTHEVRFKKDGYRSLKETVIVNEDTDGPVVLRVHLSSADPQAVRVPSGEGSVDRLGPSRSTYGWLATGTGAAFLGTGIVLTAMDGNTTCADDVPEPECPEVYATGAAGLTFGILGSALLTGGVTLLTWDHLAGAPVDDPVSDEDEPAPETEPAASMSIGPSVGADGAGLLLQGKF
jgi:hypothetical protein